MTEIGAAFYRGFLGCGGGGGGRGRGRVGGVFTTSPPWRAPRGCRLFFCYIHFFVCLIYLLTCFFIISISIYIIIYIYVEILLNAYTHFHLIFLETFQSKSPTKNKGSICWSCQPCCGASWEPWEPSTWRRHGDGGPGKKIGAKPWSF